MKLDEYFKLHFSADIYNLCSEVGIEDENIIGDVGSSVARILLGQISPKLLGKTIVDTATLPQVTAEKIVEHVEKTIFPKLSFVVNKDDAGEDDELINKENVLTEIENPTPALARITPSKPTPEPQPVDVTAPLPPITAALHEKQSLLPEIEIMPHTTEELLHEQEREISIQKQISTSFIEKKLTVPQKTSAVSAAVPKELTPPGAPLSVPRYIEIGKDPYREQPK